MKFTIIILFALLCIHILNRYSMIDIALGNAGKNVKPIPNYHFELIKNTIQKMGKSFDYENKQVNDAIIEYIIKHLNNIKRCYRLDIKYTLYPDLLKETKSYIKESEYHEISLDLKYYEKYLKNEKDISGTQITKNIYDAFSSNPNSISFMIKHFIKHTKAYLINKKILKSQELSTKIEKDTNEIVTKALNKLELINSAKQAEKKNRIAKQLKVARIAKHTENEVSGLDIKQLEKIVIDLEKNGQTSDELSLRNSVKHTTEKAKTSDQLPWEDPYVNTVEVPDMAQLVNSDEETEKQAKELSELLMNHIEEQAKKETGTSNGVSWKNIAEQLNKIEVLDELKHSEDKASDELSLQNSVKHTTEKAKTSDQLPWEDPYVNTVEVPDMAQLANSDEETEKQAKELSELLMNHIEEQAKKETGTSNGVSWKNIAEQLNKIEVLDELKHSEDKASDELSLRNSVKHTTEKAKTSDQLPWEDPYVNTVEVSDMAQLANSDEETEKQAKELSELLMNHIEEQAKKETGTSNGVSWKNIAEQLNKIEVLDELKHSENKASAGVPGMLCGIPEAQYKLDSIHTFSPHPKRRKFEDINDSTHMSLFSVLVILCSVTALALCVTLSYHIAKKKQQPNITYTAMDMMNPIHI